MSEFAQILAYLLAALYWGGVVMVDLVATPARFRTPNADRATILAVGRSIFGAVSRAQVAIGGLLFVVVLLGGGDIQVIVPALFLLVLAAAGAGMSVMMSDLLSDNKTDEEREANRPLHTQLHRAYMAADVFKILLGIILIAALVTTNS